MSVITVTTDAMVILLFDLKLNEIIFGQYFCFRYVLIFTNFLSYRILVHTS